MTMSMMSASFPCFNHEVFLCFRGPDVRTNFLECLHRRLTSHKIDVFRDSEGIKTTEPITEKLIKCIHDAEICVPIFSKDFASSPNCLMEVEQMVALGKTVIPIFYGVKPHVVRYQLDTYEVSFRKHIDISPSEILKWREALRKVSEFRGEELLDIEEGYQELIDRVVDRLWDLLRKDHQSLPKHYVDAGDHVQIVLTKLEIHCSEDGRVLQEQHLSGKHVVGLSGPQGIGKTTLAKVLYNSIRPLFQITGSCVLLDVRRNFKQKTLPSLQKKLISDLQGSCPNLESLDQGAEFIKRKFENKPVLIVLDDIEHFDQIELLLGVLNWLGPGSRVLLTSDRRDIIKQLEGHDLIVSGYEVERLHDDKAQKLFCRHAFRMDHPEEGFADIVKRITEQLMGIPRYIELVGSCLYLQDNCNRRGLWQEMQEMLDVVPIGIVTKLTKRSDRNLDENTNHIFLDIACLFNGMDKAIPSHLWKACDKYPNWGMYRLWSLYWLNFGENNVLQMPNDMVIHGKWKVNDEDHHPLNRSRIWDLDDAKRTLEDIKGQNGKKVQALCLADDISRAVCFSYPQLCLLSELRVLRLSHANLYGNPTKIVVESSSSSSKNSVPTKIVPGQKRAPGKNVLPELRWLSWQGCDGVSLLHPLHAERLVILDLSWSGISFTESTDCWRKFFKGVERLRVLDLSGCSGVSVIFPLPMSLERLLLDHCGFPFPKQCSSLRNLHNLVSLSIRHCQLGDELPRDLVKLKALTELQIDGTRVVKLPEDLMKQLEVLSANDCKNMEQIPQFEESSKMRVLSFKGCEKVHEIPDSIGNLICLEVLDLSETMIKEVPNSFSRLQKLEVVRMRRTFLKEVPEVVNKMVNLKEKDFSEFVSLKGGGGGGAE